MLGGVAKSTGPFAGLGLTYRPSDAVELFTEGKLSNVEQSIIGRLKLRF